MKVCLPKKSIKYCIVLYENEIGEYKYLSAQKDNFVQKVFTPKKKKKKKRPHSAEWMM